MCGGDGQRCVFLLTLLLHESVCSHRRKIQDNERTCSAQDWRIRQGWSGVYCNAALLRSVWLAQTECTGRGHRLSLLLTRSACAPESDLSPQGTGLSPGTDCPAPGGEPLPGATARDVQTQAGANSTHDRHRAGAPHAPCRPASPDRTGGKDASIRSAVETG